MGWAFWGAYVIDKFGRRRMLLTSLSGMLFLGFLPWTVCAALYDSDGLKNAGPPVIAFIFIFNAFCEFQLPSSLFFCSHCSVRCSRLHTEDLPTSEIYD
jgi:hypothetical protein